MHRYLFIHPATIAVSDVSDDPLSFFDVCNFEEYREGEGRAYYLVL